jgi:hypothetical protein
MEADLMREHSFSSRVCRFLEYGRSSLLGSACDSHPLPEATEFEPLAILLKEALDKFNGSLTLGLDSEDTGSITPLMAAFNLGNYACEAADHLITHSDHDQDIAMEAIFELSDDIDDLPFLRLIPCNEFRRSLLAQIPQGNHFLFPWLTEGVEFASDSLERIIQTWDALWNKTAPREDTKALVPVLTAIQSDIPLMNHLKSEAGFHASVMQAAGELSRRQHIERARQSAEQKPGIIDHILSWLRMPAVSGAVALTLMFGIYFATQTGQDGQPMPVGVSMEMLVYQHDLTVRGGEEAKPEVRKPGDTPPKEGDSIQLRFMLESPAYVYLFHQEPDDKRELLFSGLLEKGIHVFPDGNRRMRIVNSQGDEGLILVASKKALSDTELGTVLQIEGPDSSSERVVIHFGL